MFTKLNDLNKSELYPRCDFYKVCTKAQKKHKSQEKEGYNHYGKSYDFPFRKAWGLSAALYYMTYTQDVEVKYKKYTVEQWRVVEKG